MSTLAKQDRRQQIAEHADKLKKTVRFEQEAPSAAASSDPTVSLTYLASGEKQDRPEPVLVLISGHVVDDIQSSALDDALRDGWTRESFHQRSVGVASRRRCRSSQGKCIESVG